MEEKEEMGLYQVLRYLVNTSSDPDKMVVFIHDWATYQIECGVEPIAV